MGKWALSQETAGRLSASTSKYAQTRVFESGKKWAFGHKIAQIPVCRTLFVLQNSFGILESYPVPTFLPTFFRIK